MTNVQYTSLTLGSVVSLAGGSCDMTVVSIDSENEYVEVAWTNKNDEHETASYFYECFTLK